MSTAHNPRSLNLLFKQNNEMSFVTGEKVLMLHLKPAGVICLCVLFKHIEELWYSRKVFRYKMMSCSKFEIKLNNNWGHGSQL